MATQSRIWKKSDHLRMPAGWRKVEPARRDFWIGPASRTSYEDPRDNTRLDHPWEMHLGPTGEAFFYDKNNDVVTWVDPRFGDPSLTVAELADRHGKDPDWHRLVEKLRARPSNSRAQELWKKLLHREPRNSGIRYPVSGLAPHVVPQGATSGQPQGLSQSQVSAWRFLYLYPLIMSSIRFYPYLLLGHFSQSSPTNALSIKGGYHCPRSRHTDRASTSAQKSGRRAQSLSK